MAVDSAETSCSLCIEHAFATRTKGIALDAITSLRGQFGRGHEIIETAVAGLSPEQLHYRGEGSTIQSIAAIYSHTVLGEDGLLNGMARGQASLYDSGGWAAKTGIDGSKAGQLSDQTSDALREVDFAALREYAQTVYAETDAWLATLSESDLDRSIHISWMNTDMPLGQFIGSVVAWHTIHHGGEIAALTGVQGGHGLAF